MGHDARSTDSYHCLKRPENALLDWACFGSSKPISEGDSLTRRNDEHKWGDSSAAGTSLRRTRDDLCRLA